MKYSVQNNLHLQKLDLEESQTQSALVTLKKHYATHQRKTWASRQNKAKWNASQNKILGMMKMMGFLKEKFQGEMCMLAIPIPPIGRD